MGTKRKGLILQGIILDENNNKVSAIINNYGTKYKYNIPSVIKAITEGVKIEHAIVMNNQLYFDVSYRKNDYTGQMFGKWKVMEYIGCSETSVVGRWLCYCTCGCNTIRAIKEPSLQYGESQSCNKARQFIDLTDKYFGKWHVLEYAGHNLWKCECTCGCNTVRNVLGDTLRNGNSKSCGIGVNQFEDLTDIQFNSLTPKEYLGNQYWRCKCVCGEFRDVFAPDLKRGTIKSCGHDVIKFPYNTQQSFKEYLLTLAATLGHTPFVKEIAIELDYTVDNILYHLHKFSLEYLVQISAGTSAFEQEIFDYIKSLGVKCERHNRTIIKPLELDVYLPEHNIAIECNGDYWHSADVKPENYHINKTLKAANNNVRVIHIFEHEWIKYEQKIKMFIAQQLAKNITRIYAKDCNIKEITVSEYTNFLNNYHLQNSVACTIAYGLYYNDTLVEVMTFGKPRFNTDYDVELLRLCTKEDYIVIGGAAKLLKHFTTNNPDKTIISYCDLSKFTGEVYDKLGFKLLHHSKPNYFYVNSKTLETLTRYQCMKHRLVAQGFSETLTEAEIMKQRGFNKIYDCGNAVYVYEPTK